MEWARKHRRARRVLVVLEEAHTIIPETVWSGFDADTQWVVGRIAQVALQGRKYGVGLLIISQRTALVSKSILSQCNTHVTFSLVDKTSLNYLSNVYSQQHVLSIPNLRFLEAMAYGKAIRSERPVLIKLRYDPAKKTASDTLTQKLKPDREGGTVEQQALGEEVSEA
jgi:DNA helicase HerA-like ATPase